MKKLKKHISNLLVLLNLPAKLYKFAKTCFFFPSEQKGSTHRLPALFSILICQVFNVLNTCSILCTNDGLNKCSILCTNDGINKCSTSNQTERLNAKGKIRGGDRN